MTKKRCGWVSDDPLYIDYHDNEWGRPEYDDQKLFEMLCLEGAQAGLSWITVLKKRKHYRKVFDNFDPVKIAEYDDKKSTPDTKDRSRAINFRANSAPRHRTPAKIPTIFEEDNMPMRPATAPGKAPLFPVHQDYELPDGMHAL